VLPLALGFRGAYLLAVLMDVVVGVAAVFLARRQGEPVATRRDVAEAPPAEPAEHEAAESTPRPAAAQTGARDLRLPPWLIWAAAFVSGFTTLAVEVIWTRLFSQVLHNSAYTYALVLATFLLALSLGAAIANLLARSRRMPPELLLGVLLLACAAMTAISP
jgi:spermidine synthase